MKVNKKILLLLPLLVVFLLLWYAFQPAASTAEFLHNSVEYARPHCTRWRVLCSKRVSLRVILSQSRS